MSFEASRLRRGELLAAAGGVLLLVFMLAGKWYGRGGQARTGWEALTSLRWLVAVTIALAFGLAITQVTRRAPAVPVTMSLIVAVIGLITVLALIYRVLISHPTHERAGAYLGLLSAIALAYGGYLSLRQEGIARRDAPRDIPTVRLGGGHRS
jgi:putative Mn2+ efflux pump MntP